MSSMTHSSNQFEKSTSREFSEERPPVVVYRQGGYPVVAAKYVDVVEATY